MGKAWLIIASFCFYAWWDTSFITLLCVSILFNYLIGLFIIRIKSYRLCQSIFFIGGITANLLALCYYKYLFSIVLASHEMGWNVPLNLTYSILQTANRIGWHVPLNLTNIALPLGISFFTFTQIGYLIDCKADTVKDKNFLDYALFVTFFPHLIAGPILSHREMTSQFTDPTTYRFNFGNIAIGLAIFFLGLTKKVLVADHFAITANHIFSHVDQLTLLQAWSGAISFTLQIYFDFSGYSEMAMGLALLFNLRFPANFDSPFKSASIIEFWQRWHMTLTRYITLYLYNPMALWVRRYRVAHGQNISSQALTTLGGFLALVAFPTIVTMMLAGIWHGAGLQFLVFGMLHGVYLTINHAWRILTPKTSQQARRTILHGFRTAMKVLLTITAVIVANVFFRALSVHDGLSILRSMLGLNGIHADRGINAPQGFIEQWLTPNNPYDSYFSTIGFTNLYSIVVTFLFIWTVPNILQIFSPYRASLSTPLSPPSALLQKCPSVLLGIITGLIALLGLLSITDQPVPFLYFKF